MALSTAGVSLNTAGVGLSTAGVGLNAAALTLNTAALALSTASTAGAAGGIGGIFGLAAKIFTSGGIVPSAAGGMIAGGGGLGSAGGILSILHPQEMVLPAAISSGLQGMISAGNAPTSSQGGAAGGGGFAALAQSLVAQGVPPMMAFFGAALEMVGAIPSGAFGGGGASLNYAPTINTSGGGQGISRADFNQILADNAGGLIGQTRNLIAAGWRAV